jgi:hypothetical protein
MGYGGVQINSIIFRGYILGILLQLNKYELLRITRPTRWNPSAIMAGI